jgi:hypothetical protein
MSTKLSIILNYSLFHFFQTEDDNVKIPYNTFSSIDSENSSSEKHENGVKPNFYVSDECELKSRPNAEGNTKL